MASRNLLSDIPSRLSYQFDSILLDANECFVTSAGLSDCKENPASFKECYPDSDPPEVPVTPLTSYTAA